MKGFATPHTNSNSNSNSDFPLYLQKLPGQDRPQLANPWDSLARASHRPIPEIPAELSVRISGRAPHELSRTTLYVADLLLCGDLLRLRSEEVADTLHISPTTLRRRLRADGTNYQSILVGAGLRRSEQLLSGVSPLDRT